MVAHGSKSFCGKSRKRKEGKHLYSFSIIPKYSSLILKVLTSSVAIYQRHPLTLFFLRKLSDPFCRLQLFWI